MDNNDRELYQDIQDRYQRERLGTPELRQCSECGQDFTAHLPGSTLCRGCGDAQWRARLRNEGLRQVAEQTPQARLEWIIRSGLPEMFRGKRLDNFVPAAGVDQALTAVSNFNWRGEQSLIMAGGYGLGKSHLLAALVNKIAEEMEPVIWSEASQQPVYPMLPVHYTTETELLRRLRATYGEGATETEDGVYRQLSRYRVLIVDDVGKMRARDLSWTQGVYFSLIDDRYARGQLMVLTTNLEWAELEAHIGGACADRLRGMCGKSGLITLTGDSKRRQK